MHDFWTLIVSRVTCFLRVPRCSVQHGTISLNIPIYSLACGLILLPLCENCYLSLKVYVWKPQHVCLLLVPTCCCPGLTHPGSQNLLYYTFPLGQDLTSKYQSSCLANASILGMYYSWASFFLRAILVLLHK